MDRENLTFRDKFLPVQPFMRQHFDASEEDLLAGLQDAITEYCRLRTPDEEFKLKPTQVVASEVMASTPIVLRFLQVLIQATGARRVLEVGAFIGISAIYMAKVLPEDGRLVTIEKYDEFARIAAENIRENGLSERIEVICGDAFEELPKLGTTELFDFIFLDGNKERYREYFELLDGHLRPGGLLIVDDVLFLGDPLNSEPKTEKGLGVKRFLEAAKREDRYKTILLPIASGMMLMYKCE